MMGSIVLGALLVATAPAAGCYDPTLADGLPCSADDHCPNGQQCDVATHRCLRDPGAPADARDVDAPTDTPLGELRDEFSRPDDNALGRLNRGCPNFAQPQQYGISILMFVRSKWLISILFWCGCGFTAGGATNGSDNSSSSDGSLGDSLSSSDAGTLDGTPTGTCALPSDRVCVDSTHAGYCDATRQPVVDRPCPPNSMCMAGHCRQPTGAMMCAKASDCASGVCDLYVVGVMLKGYCTIAVGSGGLYTSCAPPGNDASCATGICAVDGEDNAHKQCLVPCRVGMDGDCGMGGSCHSIGQPMMIEGVLVAGSACFK